MPQDIQNEFNSGFESGMQILWDKYSTNIPLLMRHMTLYFAQFRPDGSKKDLYSLMLQGLQAKGILSNILFSSLNYECVLEFAASSLGLSCNYFDLLLDKTYILLWKLHGSCNFIPEGISATGNIQYTQGVIFDTALKGVNPNDAIGFCLSDTSLYPAMALYAKSKPIQIGHRVISSLQTKWAEAIMEAKRVLVIGVRPYPEDTHIWKPLAQTPAILGYAGQENEFRNWVSIYRQNLPVEWIGSNWDCVLDKTIAFIGG